MAEGSCNNGVGNGVFELEAMRKYSFSWHPCQVSLCSRGLGIVVQYGDNHGEEVIANKQEVFARIRVRSTPLQGDGCSSLQQGDHVLATQNLHAVGSYYDALVEEATRVRHSRRAHCRCSFTIQWVHQPLAKEAVTIPASAIMKLATKSINLHPVISTFFSMLESSNGLDALPGSTVVDSMNWEMDINVLLEKQIKEISNSTDVSQEKIPKNFVFGLEVDLKGQSQRMTIDASLKDPCVTIPLLNDTVSENEKPTETGTEIPPASIPSMQEEFTGSRSPLNPLAARAALASLRSNFPQDAELLVQSNVEKGDITNEHCTGKLLYESKCGSLSTVSCLSNSNEFSLKISATLGGRSSNFESIVKTLFPTSSAPQIVKFSKGPSIAPVNGTEKKNVISEKSSSRTSEMRLTRAQTQRNDRMHESTQMANTKETQLRSSKTRRVTRSTVNQEEKIEAEEHNAAIGENMQTKCIKLDSSAQNTITLQNCLSDKRKLLTSPFVDKASMCSAGNGKSFKGEDEIIAVVDSPKGNFAEYAEKHNHPKRLTRSAAREKAEKNKLNKLKHSKSNSYESNEIDFVKGNASVESNTLDIEKSLTSPKITEQFTKEQEDGQIFTHVRATPNSAEGVIGSGKSTKRTYANSKQHERRFSPRLRTHSENKD